MRIPECRYGSVKVKASRPARRRYDTSVGNGSQKRFGRRSRKRLPTRVRTTHGRLNSSDPFPPLFSDSSTKSILETCPILHECDETIRGHVFCSFLALVLRKELEDCLEANGQKSEWADISRDLINLQYAEVEQDGKRFLLRSEAQGSCGRVFSAAGVALPPTVQQIEAA